MSTKQEFVVHTPEEMCGIRKAAAAAATVRERLRQMIFPGMSTLQVDELAYCIIAQLGGVSAFFGYKNFPGQICISLNDEVVHGIGSTGKILCSGDLISVDIGVSIDSFIGDTAASFIVGDASPLQADVRMLLEKTHEALISGIGAAKAGNRVRDISAAVEKVAKLANLGVVREYVGHGVGCALHEPPEIPNFTSKNTGTLLRDGMVLAIEPMFNLGTYKVKTDKDRWTVRTADGRLSAHFEHMILINSDKPEVLTWPKMM
jgi:methionyl aminopeptidase